MLKPLNAPGPRCSRVGYKNTLFPAPILMNELTLLRIRRKRKLQAEWGRYKKVSIYVARFAEPIPAAG